MTTLFDPFLLMSFVTTAYSTLTIPDEVPHADKLTYYTTEGTWYQADKVCRAHGGYLVLVNNSNVVDKLQQLNDTAGPLKEFWTRMVLHDEKFYSHDDSCSPVSVTSWAWVSAFDGDTISSLTPCVTADGDSFLWKKSACSSPRKNYVCQNHGGTCNFQLTSTSLVTLPNSKASMEECQVTCRQMIGCFATAPSGYATLSPFTHCIFLVLGDDSNLMATLDNCPNVYSWDTETDPNNYHPAYGDPIFGPDTCVPDNVTRTSDAGGTEQDQRPLMEFLLDANVNVRLSNTQTSIDPCPVVQTDYVTITPEERTVYVTATPQIQHHNVTVTAAGQTVYVRASPETVYVTVSQGEQSALSSSVITTPVELRTGYVTATPSMTHDVVMTTVTETVSVTVPAMQSCNSYDQPGQPAQITTTVTVPQTYVVTQTQTYTATITPTPTLPLATTLCPSSYPDISTSTSVNSSNNNDNNSSSSNNNNNRTEVVMRELNALVKELTVDPHNVSRSRRKKESAKDERPSAQTIGGGAVVFLTAVVFLVVLVDVPSLYNDVQCLKRVAGSSEAAQP